MHFLYLFFFFFNDTATTEIYTLSLHDALPIYGGARPDRAQPPGTGRGPAVSLRDLLRHRRPAAGGARLHGAPRARSRLQPADRDAGRAPGEVLSGRGVSSELSRAPSRSAVHRLQRPAQARAIEGAAPRAVSAVASPRDLRDSLPRAGRHVLAECPLDQRHEDWPLGVWDVGTEHFPALHGENARTLELDRQGERRGGLIAQKRDAAPRRGIEADASVRVGREHLAQRVQRADERESDGSHARRALNTTFPLERMVFTSVKPADSKACFSSGIFAFIGVTPRRKAA